MSTDYIYSEDQSNNTELIAKLIVGVNKWANSIPHHPYKNLGNKIEVKSVHYRPAYPIIFKSQYEERQKSKGHEPYTGQKIPERTYYDLSEVNSWDLTLNEVESFINDTENYYVKGSQYVENCHHCHAKGWITCTQCGGAASVTCPSCNGSKVKTCSSCNGHGQSTCSSCNGKGYVDSKRQCGTCGGYGQVRNPGYKPQSTGLGADHREWVPCYNCGGKGHTGSTTRCGSCSGSGKVQCRTCGGKGKVTCSRCHGSGRITCPKCSGTGKNTCPTCEGHKQLMHFFRVTRKLRFSRQATCIIHDSIFDKFPEFNDKWETFESSRKINQTEDFIESSPLPKDHFLHKFIAGKIKQAVLDKGDYEQILFQNLEVNIIDAWELEYTFNGKYYSMVLYGSNYDVIPGNSPIAEVAYSYLKRSKTLVNLRAYTMAWRLIRKSQKIGTYEIAEEVDLALDRIESKLNESYGFGSKAAGLLLAFFGSFVAYQYFSKINWVFDYVSFINNPENFLYSYHAWAQTIAVALLCYWSATPSTVILKRLKGHIPSGTTRFIAGFTLTVIIGSLLSVAWGFLNATGITIIAAFIAWLAVKIFKIVVVIIYLLYKVIAWIFGAIWWIIKWIFSLF